MMWVDLVIVIALAAATLTGFAEGFFRSVCSLGGLVLALIVASWNYAAVAKIFLPLIHFDDIANALAFLVVAVVVVGLVNLIVDVLIVQPTKITAMYDALVPSAQKKQIDVRDGKH